MGNIYASASSDGTQIEKRADNKRLGRLVLVYSYSSIIKYDIIDGFPRLNSIIHNITCN